MTPPLGVTVIGIDTRTGSSAVASLESIAEASGNGLFVWVDIDCEHCDPNELEGVLPPPLAAGILGEQRPRPLDEHAVAALDFGDAFMRMRISGAALHGRRVESDPIDIVVSEGMVLTVHRGPSRLLDVARLEAWRHIPRDSAPQDLFALTLWTAQVEQFLTIQSQLDEEVDTARMVLRQEIDGRRLFERLVDVVDPMLALRKRALPARRVLEELLSRKTAFTSESSLERVPHLIASLDRLLDDISGNREILHTAMNLSLTVATHQTNTTMKHLTVVSTIFLPLTFLCGVYGMNFKTMPETEWRHGYLAFWLVSLVLTMALTAVMRRTRML